MPISPTGEPKRSFHIWIVAVITVILATAFLAVRHAVSWGLAVLIGVVALVGISLGILRTNAKPSEKRRGYAVGRLILILFVAGILFGVRILGEGWQKEDAIAVAVYALLLCGLLVIY